MAQLGLSLISVFLSLYSTVPRTIERAFLENNAAVLATLFPGDMPLLVSLPEPIAFSDVLSEEQAFWMFERLFRSYPTIEFYPETGHLPESQRGGFILKGRWSVLDRLTQLQTPLQVFFYLRPRPGPKIVRRTLWAITEIKAEKI